MTQQSSARRIQSLAGLTTFVTLFSACSATEPSALGPSPVEQGEQLFRQAFPDTNGRSCATCHVPEDNFTLTPSHVAELFDKNPNDPLFSAIDADDPTSAPLTFEHLKKGLVRVWLTLPENVDVIDEDGNVTTPADRRLFVWRSVPSIVDGALTAPYQLDGREPTLERQAQGAVSSHSRGGPVSESELELIAQFERAQFSSERSRSVAVQLARGVEPADIGDVDASLQLSAAEERGKEIYGKVCASCHGGSNLATIVDSVVHDMAFPALKPDGTGTVRYEVPATEPPTPLLAPQRDNHFVNIGSAMENFLVQIEATEHESFTKSLSFPAYRFRFYKDAARAEITADLPPALPPGDPFMPVVDTDGNPVFGPNLFLQLFTTDPGRAAITGDPYDFEAFDIPTLRGIAKTGPYWHNNISESLEEVVDLYSDHLLSKFPTLTLPGEKELDEDGDIGPPEALTAEQKSDLVAFLKRL
jgi:cytochrome c peroxidase